jgi:hypothetical protein
MLTPNIGPAHPSNLSLPHHGDCFRTLNRSSRGLELSESLLDVHSSFDGTMVLLDDVVQVLHGPVPTSPLDGVRAHGSCPILADQSCLIRFPAMKNPGWPGIVIECSSACVIALKRAQKDFLE